MFLDCYESGNLTFDHATMDDPTRSTELQAASFWGSLVIHKPFHHVRVVICGRGSDRKNRRKKGQMTRLYSTFLKLFDAVEEEGQLEEREAITITV